VNSFQPSEGYLRYIKFWFWLLFWPMDVAILVGMIALYITVPIVAIILTVPAIILAVAPDILIYIGLLLKYDTTWYVMTDRSLRIRRGVWVIHEVTITFENVQNLRIRNGPLQRYFGIADLIVETAGGGVSAGGKHGGDSMGHNGIIEGISNAEELRDHILASLRHSKTAGLGDEDHAHDRDHPAAKAAGWSREHVEALRAIRDEVRAMAAA